MAVTLGRGGARRGGLRCDRHSMRASTTVCLRTQRGHAIRSRVQSLRALAGRLRAPQRPASDHNAPHHCEDNDDDRQRQRDDDGEEEEEEEEEEDEEEEKDEEEGEEKVQGTRRKLLSMALILPGYNEV